MAFLRQSFGFIFALIAGLLLVVSLLVVTPLYFVLFIAGGAHASHTAHKLSRLWAGYVLFCCGLALKVHGKKKINSGQTYIFVSNHRSYLDIPVCALTTRHTFKFLAKEELGKTPLLGYIIRKLYITVRRQSARDGVRSLQKMQEELEKGISVWLYPEGSRNKTNEPLTKFQDGAFTLAVKTGVPIAVCTIYDTRKILRPGNLFQLIPGRVNAWWDEPIETKGLTRDDIPALKEKVQALMLKHIPDEI